MPRLHPNPPRLVTVGIAVALLVAGTVLALPIPAAVGLLDPLAAVVEPFGLTFDAAFGYLCLFAGNALLIAGSLLPGI
ncbi:MAG: hypothetical protein MUE92_03210 [Chloroflexi bacterium]|jgi:hypothetical protein|nr:hypothetical protein [Chloroflexota bacterium]